MEFEDSDACQNSTWFNYSVVNSTSVLADWIYWLIYGWTTHTHTLTHTHTHKVLTLTFYCLSPSLSLVFYQMGLGSESQQRKRKAPAPPPTPASITSGSDDTSTSPEPTPDNYATTTPTAFCTKVTESAPVSSTTVIVHTVKPVPLKKVAQPAIQTASSPTPSSSTTDSLATQYSSSEVSHSLDDSDADLEAGSYYSTLTSSTASGSVRMQPAMKSSSSRMEESEMSSSMAAKSSQEGASASSSRLETESAVNLKLDEVESNRHSAMGKWHTFSTAHANKQSCTWHRKTVDFGRLQFRFRLLNSRWDEIR